MEEYKTFKELEFIETDPFMGGIMTRMMFPNGYGVSVVKHRFSYGGDRGLYEIAVLDSDGNICYETEITNNVIGYLTEDDVTYHMEKVQKL